MDDLCAKDAEYLYVAIRKSDGSMRAMCVDDEGEGDNTGFHVGDWIRRGLMVVRMSDAEFRKRLAPETTPATTTNGAHPASLSPPPIPTQDHGQADQSPYQQGIAAGKPYPSIADALRAQRAHDQMKKQYPEKFGPFSEELQDDFENAKTRIVRPHMTEGA
jgi:hypothetical protein